MGMIGRFATRMRLSLLVRPIVEFPTQQNSRPASRPAIESMDVIP
jgi:hypothetical protein